MVLRKEEVWIPRDRPEGTRCPRKDGVCRGKLGGEKEKGTEVFAHLETGPGLFYSEATTPSLVTWSLHIMTATQVVL